MHVIWTIFIHIADKPCYLEEPLNTYSRQAPLPLGFWTPRGQQHTISPDQNSPWEGEKLVTQGHGQEAAELVKCNPNEKQSQNNF